MAIRPHSLPRVNAVSRQSGFTLIETLVAFALLALAFSAMIPLFRDTLAKTHDAALVRIAASLAESKLAELQALGLPANGKLSGIDGNFRWSVEAMQHPELLPDNSYELAAFDVNVAVTWRNGGQDHTVSLRTLRLGLKSSPQ